jgi:hypothetical protein
LAINNIIIKTKSFKLRVRPVFPKICKKKLNQKQADDSTKTYHKAIGRKYIHHQLIDNFQKLFPKNILISFGILNQ